MSINFVEMSAEERNVWVADYKQWLSEDKEKVSSATILTSEIRNSCEKIFLLISAFPFCRAFAAESLRFKDYMRRRTLLFRYIDRVSTSVKGILGEDYNLDLTDPKLLKKHVGRPTKDEAAARALVEKKRKEEEENKETLFGKGFDVSQNIPPEPSSISGTAAIGSRLHLDQLKWLLSPTLQEAVDTVRTLRNESAESATRAKQMAEDGRKPEEISPYAQVAAEKTEAYENIYEQVDNELAVVYVRLKEDTTYRDKMISRGADTQELRTILRPYWDKIEDKDLFKQKVIDDIKANDPKQAKIRDAEEAKKKKVADIIKYLCRKDKMNTAKRISTMTERYAELEKLIGEEAKTYLPVLEAAKADYETNYKDSKSKG